MHNCCKYTDFIDKNYYIKDYYDVEIITYNVCEICNGNSWHVHKIRTMLYINFDFDCVIECNSCHNCVIHFINNNIYKVDYYINNEYILSCWGSSVSNTFNIFEIKNDEIILIPRLMPKFQISNNVNKNLNKIKNYLTFS